MNSESLALFGPAHLSVFLTMGLCLGILLALLRVRPELDRSFSWALALVLVGSKLAALWIAFHGNTLTWQNGLPMHLCDWATGAVVFALLFRRPWIYEAAYFWGLAGTTQALLTPDLNFTFPDPRYFTFFISHGGIVVGVLYLTWGAGFRPRPGSVWRVFGLTQIYLAATLVVNLCIGANYGYLLAKPSNPSLLDHLGPWPWYIVSMEVAALVFFWLVYLPFRNKAADVKDGPERAEP